MPLPKMVETIGGMDLEEINNLVLDRFDLTCMFDIPRVVRL